MNRKTCKASVTAFAFNICRGVDARLCAEKEREELVSRGYVTRGGSALCVLGGPTWPQRQRGNAREVYLKVTRQREDSGECPMRDNERFSCSCVYLNFHFLLSPNFPSLPVFFLVLQECLSCSVCISASSHMLVIVLGRLCGL